MYLIILVTVVIIGHIFSQDPFDIAFCKCLKCLKVCAKYRALLLSYLLHDLLCFKTS